MGLFYAQARTEEYAAKAACGPRGEQGEKASPTRLRSPMQRKYAAKAAHGVPRGKMSAEADGCPVRKENCVCAARTPRARGDDTDDLDIDIALLVKCDRLEAKKFDDALAEIGTKLAMKYFAVVNFVSLPYGEFAEKRTWYSHFKNIDMEGEALYG